MAMGLAFQEAIVRERQSSVKSKTVSFTGRAVTIPGKRSMPMNHRTKLSISRTFKCISKLANLSI